MPTWAVGSRNGPKLDAVEAAVRRCWPDAAHRVVAVTVESGVGAQPMDADETQRGSVQRAHAALQCVAEADYGVGIEGGLERVGERWFECGWVAVVERTTRRCGLASSARFEMSPVLMHPILAHGKELADVIDAMTEQTDVRSGMGAMGVLTAGHLCRASAYEHGVIFALAPFLSSPRFWSDADAEQCKECSA